MRERPHQIVSRPDAGAPPLSCEGRTRRRFARRLRLLGIPGDLRGWSVLDVGAWHGFFSFECERRGADRVLAVDSYAWDRFGMDEFLAARERLGSSVEYRRADAHELDPDEIGRFDLVLLLGVFYHLRNPLAALERIARVTRRLLICETHVLLPFVHERYPLVPFFPGDEDARGTPRELCAMPTLTALERMLQSVGFSEVETVYTPSFRYWKKLVALVTNRPRSGRGIVHARVPSVSTTKEKNAMKIAVLGMGTMGAPMAANLIKAGCEVTVHNRTRNREEPLAQLGAARADSPAAAAAEADVVLSCVSDTPDVEHVLLESGSGALHGLKEGGLVIDCSSIAPAATRRIAERFRARGIGYVDAPVSGGSEGAVKGTLTIMCGGTEEDFARAEPVLQIIGAKVTRIGPVGCGQIAKVANQVAIAGTFMALAEALTLAYRAGANPERVVEAIGGGVAGSWILNNRSDKMLNDDYPLGFRTRLHRKDLGIALDTAREFQVPAPIASLVATVEDALIAQGYGDEDMSNLARFVREGAAVPNGPMKA